MPFVFKRLALLLSIAGAFAADKEQAFRAPAASEMPRRQTVEQVTIGVESYVSGDKVKLAFGKLVPADHGVLPVLVVIQNAGSRAIQLKSLQVEYVAPDGKHAVATPAGEVKYIVGPDPNLMQHKTLHAKKNPLDVWEIEGRAFSALMLPAGNTASGFFYFRANLQSGATLYLSGMKEAGTGKDLMFFEVPLN